MAQWHVVEVYTIGEDEDTTTSFGPFRSKLAANEFKQMVKRNLPEQRDGGVIFGVSVMPVWRPTISEVNRAGYGVE